MKKKLLIILNLFLIALTVLISAPITSSSQLFRAIIYDKTPIPVSTAKISIIPSTVSIKSDKNVWDIKNDIVTLDSTSYDIFTWTIEASTYSPITLRINTSPLRKEDDPSHKINFRLDFELDPPTLNNYKMYQNGKNSDKKSTTMPSLILSTVNSDNYSKKTVGSYDNKFVYYQRNGANYWVDTPNVYDYVQNVSQVDGKFVASLESTSTNPLEITYQFKVYDDRNDPHDYYPLNYKITRTGTAKISLYMPDSIIYGTYVSPLYIELEVE